MVNLRIYLRTLTRILFYSFVTIFISLFFSLFSSSHASAAPTVITGTISGIPEDSYGIAWAEKYVSGEWIEISSSYTKDLYRDQGYKINLGEATGADVRIWAQCH